MEAYIARDMLRTKLAEALTAAVPALTVRDVHVLYVSGKAFAVIGVRRGGKTSFLRSRMPMRIAIWEREVRSLLGASRAMPNARALLVTLDPTPPSRDLPAPLEWNAASEWLLADTS